MAARLPNFCNAGIMLRMLVIVSGLVFAAAVVRLGPGTSLLTQLLEISILAQPTIILTLVLTCALQPVFARIQYWQGVALIALSGAILGYGLARAIPLLLPQFGNMPAAQVVFLVEFSIAVVLIYFDLRSRALSPAINEARLQALQARIRPHFLFNSLNAVLSLIRTEPRQAERILEDMSELFRVLMADNRKLTPLSAEVDLCRRYLEIEQLRLGARLGVVWKTERMPTDAWVPPLILQPLLENAVYHGIEPIEKPGNILVEIEARGDDLFIRLTNPYQAASTHVSGNRMAIANIKERLQLHFDAEATLKADILGTTYVVTINMPIVTAAPK